MNQDYAKQEKCDTNSNSAEDEDSSSEHVDDEKIAELKAQIEKKPLSYDLHTQLIALCRKLANLEELCSAREKMSKLFLLTPELWLDWLRNEKNSATTKEQKENLNLLFKKALKDYSSVSVWQEYMLFLCGNVGETWDEEGIASTRKAFDEALIAVGHHFTHGSVIWDAYRQFETDYLNILKNKNADEKDLKEQKERVYNIFKGQLTKPLFGMENTYSDFKKAFDEASCPDISSIENSYKKALQKLDQINVHEKSLSKSKYPHYEEYKEYIKYEKNNGDASRVQSVYERAIIENCLKEELWLDYIKYLDRELKIDQISLPVHERSVKILPWSVQLWVNYGKALELYEKPHEKIKEMFEKTLKNDFVEAADFRELWFAYLDYLRRRIKVNAEPDSPDLNEIEAIFTNATTQMAEYFWGSESEYLIAKYYTSFLARYKKDLKTAREYWREIISHGHKEKASIWLDYVNFERLYGDADHYRNALLQALSCVSDGPEKFLELLITFEREEGTLESLENSLARCETLMQTVKMRRKSLVSEGIILALEKRMQRPATSICVPVITIGNERLGRKTIQQKVTESTIIDIEKLTSEEEEENKDNLPELHEDQPDLVKAYPGSSQMVVGPSSDKETNEKKKKKKKKKISCLDDSVKKLVLRPALNRLTNELKLNLLPETVSAVEKLILKIVRSIFIFIKKKNLQKLTANSLQSIVYKILTEEFKFNALNVTDIVNKSCSKYSLFKCKGKSITCI